MKVLFCLLIALTASADPIAVSAKHSFGRKNVATAVPFSGTVTTGTVIVNSASYLPGVSPGGLVTVFGRDLSSVDGVVVANTNPLPLVLANVSVTVNGRPAPLFSVAYANGQDQISFQVPYKTETGLGAADVQVFNFGQLVTELTTDSYTEDPGIFIYKGKYAVAAAATDNSLIGPDNPAIPGETIILYTTGLGPLTLDLRDGYGAPSDPLAYTADPFDVVVNHEKCRVLFSGLGPGFVGLYQINIQLPRDLPSGNLDLQILSPYSDSGIATLPVQQ